jgi:hypothetical protein
MIISTAAHHVRATITYTMAPSPYTGPADPGPRIGSGVLRVESTGGAFIVPLRDLDIDPQHPSIFPQSANQGCGAGAPLTIEHAKNGRDYVVVENIAIGKGCRAAAHVVDVTTRSVVTEYAADHASAHADDVPASRFIPQKHVRVSGVERFVIPSSQPATTWTLTVIEAPQTEIFAENLSQSETPFAGETVTLGLLHDETFTAPMFVDDRTFRLSAAHERAWAARQTPVPSNVRRTRIYNMYFEYSDRLASDGRFEQALSAYRTALQYLDDPSVRAGAPREIARREAIVQSVRAGRISVAQAKRAWFNL